MGKKADNTHQIDPVMAKMAATAAAVARPATPRPVDPVEPEEANDPGGQGSRDVIADITPRRQRPLVSSGKSLHRKVMVSEEEANKNEELTRRISGHFGAKVTYSQITRAMWSVLDGTDDAMRELARKHVPPRPPSSGNALAMAQYEDAIAVFLETAIKRSKG